MKESGPATAAAAAPSESWPMLTIATPFSYLCDTIRLQQDFTSQRTKTLNLQLPFDMLPLPIVGALCKAMKTVHFSYLAHFTDTVETADASTITSIRRNLPELTQKAILRLKKHLPIPDFSSPTHVHTLIHYARLYALADFLQFPELCAALASVLQKATRPLSFAPTPTLIDTLSTIHRIINADQRKPFFLQCFGPAITRVITSPLLERLTQAPQCIRTCQIPTPHTAFCPLSHHRDMYAEKIVDEHSPNRGKIAIYNADDGSMRSMLQSPYFYHPAENTLLVFFPDDTKILISTPKKHSVICDTTTGRALYTLEEDPEIEGNPNLSSFSSDNTMFLTASTLRKTANIWNTATGKKLFTITTECCPTYSGFRYAVFSQDNTLIVTTTTCGTIQVWNARTGELLNTFNQPCIDTSISTYSVNLSHNNAKFATISSTYSYNSHTEIEPISIKIWDVATGRLLRTINMPHSCDVITFSENDALIAGLSAHEGITHVWDAETGTLLHTANCLDPSYGRFYCGDTHVNFSSNDTQMITIIPVENSTYVIKTWDLPLPPQLLSKELELEEILFLILAKREREHLVWTDALADIYYNKLNDTIREYIQRTWHIAPVATATGPAEIAAGPVPIELEEAAPITGKKHGRESKHDDPEKRSRASEPGEGEPLVLPCKLLSAQAARTEGPASCAGGTPPATATPFTALATGPAAMANEPVPIDLEEAAPIADHRTPEEITRDAWAKRH